MLASETPEARSATYASIQVAGERNRLKRFFETFFAHLKLVVSLFLGLLFLFFVISFLIEQNYGFSAEILVVPKEEVQAADATQGDPGHYLSSISGQMETEIGMLRSRTLIQRVVKQHFDEGGSESKSGMVGRRIIGPLRRLFGERVESSDDPRIQRMTTNILDNLDVDAAPASNIIQITLQHPDPTFGRNLLNKILDNYVLFRAELESYEPIGEITRQKKLLFQEDLATLQGKRLRVLNEFNASQPAKEITQLLDLVHQEEQKLNRHEDGLIETQQRMDFLSRSVENLENIHDIADYTFSHAFVDFGSWPSESAERQLRLQMETIANIAMEYAGGQLSSHADESNLQEIRARYRKAMDEHRQLIDALISQKEKQSEVYNSLIIEINNRLIGYRQRIALLNEAKLRLSRLDGEADALKETYYNFRRQFQKDHTNQYDEPNEGSEIRILGRASIPMGPESPNFGAILALGFLAALVLAICIGFLREIFDHRFKYLSQVTEHLGLPVIATLDNGANNPPSRNIVS